MIENAFQRLGFSGKEQDVYLAIADLGKTSATILSKKTKIPRATLYAVLDGLIEKGVISREQKGGSSNFLVNSPNVFVRLVEQEKEEVQAKEKAALDLVDFLTPYLKSTHYSIPKLQIFEGKQNIENMLYDYLPRWRESYALTGSYTLWGYQDPTFVESYIEWHHYMWETRDPREKICLFSNSGNVEKELRHKIGQREVRPLPEGTRFSSSIWIYGDYIVMGVTRQKPHYAVQMHDSVFAANLRTIFELLWKAHF